MTNAFFTDIIAEIKKSNLSKLDISKLKLKLCEKHKIRQPPTDIEILLNAEDADVPFLKKVLRSKPTRSISGVAVVAIMSKPHKCPHGKCSYCPGGPSSFFGNVPQSYTGREPATMRAIRNNFDPYLQVFNRLEQYIVTGHIPDKVELIVMGGTFPHLPKKYQQDLVKYALKAMNDFSGLFFKDHELRIAEFKTFFKLPAGVEDEDRMSSVKKKLSKLKKNPKTTPKLIE